MDFDLSYDLMEALTRQDLRMDDIIYLKELGLKNVPATLTDKQLALFLNIADRNIEQARKMMQRYYEILQASPELFADRDPFNESIQDCLRNQYYINLPSTPDGNLVVYHALSNSSFLNYNMTSTVKTYFMLLECTLHDHGPHNGVICLFDMKNVGLSHLTRARVGIVKKFFEFVQEAMLINIKAIHIFNAVWFFDKLIMIAKPFMNPEIFHLMHLHGPNLDYNEFAAKYLPKSSLPSDYGGDLESVEKLHEEYRAVFEKKRNYLIAEELQRQNCRTECNQ